MRLPITFVSSLVIIFRESLFNQTVPDLLVMPSVSACL
ncbi:hypothetical protein VCHENC02_5888, partial [Vibrio harveyi]